MPPASISMSGEERRRWSEPRARAEVRRALAAGALAVRTTRVDARVEPVRNGHRITATYRFEVLDRSRGSYLLLDYWACPFPIVEVETNVGEARDAGAELGEHLYIVDCAPPPPSVVTLTVVMEWPAAYVAGGERVVYLVVPDELPRVVSGATDVALTQPDVYVDTASPDRFTQVGLTHGRKGEDRSNGPHLQVALLPIDDLPLVEAGGLLFGGDAIAGAGKPRLVRVAEDFEAMFRFLGVHLGVAPLLRVAVLADSRAHDLFRPFGVVLVERPKGFGIGTDDLSLFRAQGVSHVTGIWWGAGVRVPGELGVAVSHGIAQAMVLRRLSVEQNGPDLEIMTGVMEQRAQMPLATDGSWADRAGKLGAEIALTLFDAMERAPQVPGELRMMTQEYWGHEVPAETVMRRLARVGVPIPSMRYDLM
jgi:hypothetical protein